MYLTIDYIKNLIPETDLVDLTRDKGDPPDNYNTARINELINMASGEFENYVSNGGYEIPIAEPTEFVKSIVFNLFKYHLYSRKYADEEMKDTYVRYTKAYNELNRIAKGELFLDGVPRKSNTTNAVVSYIPVMTNKALRARKFTEHLLNM